MGVDESPAGSGGKEPKVIPARSQRCILNNKAIPGRVKKPEGAGLAEMEGRKTEN
jgi:hypothetical protein